MPRTPLHLTLGLCLAWLATPALAGTPQAAQPTQPAPESADRLAEKPVPEGPGKAQPVKAAVFTPAQQRVLDQSDKLFQHLKTLFGLLGQKRQDCAAAIRAGESFVEELGPEVRKIAAELQKAEASMAKAEKEAVGKLVQERAEALMAGMQADLMAFMQACPSDAAKLGELLQGLLGPAMGKPE
jgi:hypothetical protein